MEEKPYDNGYRETIPAALRYLAHHPRPSGGEEAYNAIHLLQLADEADQWFGYLHARIASLEAALIAERTWAEKMEAERDAALASAEKVEFNQADAEYWGRMWATERDRSERALEARRRAETERDVIQAAQKRAKEERDIAFARAKQAERGPVQLRDNECEASILAVADSTICKKTVDLAANVLVNLKNKVRSLGAEWYPPHITSSDGDIGFEWAEGDNYLTIFVGCGNESARAEAVREFAAHLRDKTFSDHLKWSIDTECDDYLAHLAGLEATLTAERKK